MRMFCDRSASVAASTIDQLNGGESDSKNKTGRRTPDGFHAVTAQLNVNFTRPVSRGEVLEATGRVLHAGSQTAVASGEVRNGNGKLVATATGTFLFLRLP